ncbi:MAG: hypothetical protein ACKV2T_10640 [Kofleriaceae bacterium]
METSPFSSIHDPLATSAPVLPDRLYWIACTREGVQLRVTTDGDAWTIVALPEDVGRPTDITRWRDAVVILTEHALLRLDDNSLTRIATIDAKQFAASDLFCAAPLAVFRDELYAGGQRGGALWKFQAQP